MKEKMSKKKKVVIIFLSIIPTLIVLYFVVCISLYFFEPSSLPGALYSGAENSFSEYSIFDKSKNDKLYIKQVTKDDIVVDLNNYDRSYINNTVIAVAEDGVDYISFEQTADGYGATICGYIECASMYQLEFSGDSMSYEELSLKCDELEENSSIKAATVDYISLYTKDDPSYMENVKTCYDEYNSSDDELRQSALKNAGEQSAHYLNSISINDAWKYTNSLSSVNVGVLDGCIADYTISDLDVANVDEYSDASFVEDCESDINHATSVAGIIGAKHDGVGINGVCPTAKIYTYSTSLKSFSYELASICKMIHYEKVKAINMSYGYSYDILFSASKGDERAISYIKDQSDVAECVIQRLINHGDEFVICLASGNGGGTGLEARLYRDFFGEYDYGYKNIIRTIDMFGVFSGTKNCADAKYSYWLESIETPEVKDRIIVVGAANIEVGEDGFPNDKLNGITNYTITGDRVDIIAPTDSFSTIRHNAYDSFSGTSGATPFVTGTAAMMFAINDKLTGAEVKDMIVSSSTESFTDDTGRFTYPALNAGAAVERAAETVK